MKSYSKILVITLYGVMICLLGMWQIGVIGFTDNEPNTLYPPPIQCRYDYTEYTLMTSMHGGPITYTTVYFCYWEITWDRSHSEHYTGNVNMGRTHTESFSHSRSSSAFTNAGQVGSEVWSSRLNMTGQLVVVSGWQYTLGNQAVSSITKYVDVPPGNRYKLWFLYDQKEGYFHRHQYEMWSCYSTDWAVFDWGIMCIGGSPTWRSGNYNLRRSDAGGISQQNLRHDNGTLYPLP